MRNTALLFVATAALSGTAYAQITAGPLSAQTATLSPQIVLQTRLDRLETKVTALTAENAAMKTQVGDLKAKLGDLGRAFVNHEHPTFNGLPTGEPGCRSATNGFDCTKSQYNNFRNW
ncbi:bZIP transcription factor [Sphingomonas sp. 3P27F8]|uniref:bZIP transcription factor n=1 Tax=Sphingomonas sp. 3P27F8 TaxID=2502213 RepID=UPI0010F60157|nr:bZIP transcription factor [Sphingomonas sp. 3P27F8]